MALQAWLANLGASFKKGAQTPRFLEDVAENVRATSQIRAEALLSSTNQ